MNKITDVTHSNFSQTVLESKLPVAVIFYGKDCPICVTVMPQVLRLTEEYSGKMLFAKVSRDSNPDLCKQYGIRVSPTVLFFSGGKESCQRMAGYIRYPELKCIIEQTLSGKCECLKRDKIECDVLVLGGGPAGLTSAIYTARSKLFTVVVDDSFIGGQVATTWHVANYPGTKGAIHGIELVNNMKQQALDFGTVIDDMQDIISVSLEGRIKKLETRTADYYARSVIIATGATPKKLNVEGEKDLTGRGVHYCATCDAALYQDAHVMVVGGGNSAVEEAVYLSRFASKVTVVQREDRLTATKSAQQELFNNPSIRVLFNTEVTKISGENFVTSATLINNITKEIQQETIDGIFVYIGMAPMSKLFTGQLSMDEHGYIHTDNQLQTSQSGVFAAGDVRVKEVRQIATAVGDGAIAGIMAEKYLAGE